MLLLSIYSNGYLENLIVVRIGLANHYYSIS